MKTNISLEKVTDRQSFIEFCMSLKTDFDNDNEAWENNTLSDFLEALSAYAEGVQGYYDNFNININADVPSWRTFATILMGATVYE